MILQLTRSNPPTRRQPEWPEQPARRPRGSGALFEERPALRKLVVLIDAELLAAPDAAFSPELVLSGLLTHPDIKLLRYRDEGPPPGTPRKSYGPLAARQTAAEGWAELLPWERGDVRELIYTEASGPTYTGVQGHRAEYARRDLAAAVYQDLGPEEAAARRERDGLAAAVAEAVHADLFITERPYLFGTQAAVALGVTLCRPPEALALVGLYLRSQKEFIALRAPDGGGTIYLTGFYYWVGTREVLPAAWRWNKACGQESASSGDETLRELGESLLRRVQYALEARDRFHRAFDLPQNPDTARAVLGELDSILVSLMGAVDVSARVAHIVLGIRGDAFNAGWQKDQSWLGRVAAAEPALAALFAVGTPLRQTLTILRLLRNTVHGQRLTSITVQGLGAIRETAIQLPAEHEAEILAAMDAMGGRTAWGVRAAAGGSLVDPGNLVEQLLPNVLTLLNEVMEATPVERLGHVTLTAADALPPPDGNPPRGPGIFDEKYRLSIRWQLGL